MIYLASPYSHKNPAMKEARFHEVCKVAARFMEGGTTVFCPIAHSHPIEKHGMADIKDGDWWLKQDYDVLQHCSAVYVVTMPGWEKSYGIGKEIEFAKSKGIPVFYHPHPYPREEEVEI